MSLLEAPPSAAAAVARVGMGGREPARVAREFEAAFFRLLLAEMLPQEGGFFGEGPAGGVVRGLFVDAAGSSLAQGRGLGIAPLIEKELARFQDAAGSPAGRAGVEIDRKG